jgi:NAD(P)-dependent dehydrogenase (short-subunit alcohol dehydrogenase family)
MQNKPVALVTGANQGIGLQIAKDLVAHGFTVLVGSRNLERCEAAAKEVGPDARALQLDVTDQASITAAAERIRKELGRLDVLVNNAAISNTSKLPGMSVQEYSKLTRPSNVSLDEVRTVWETNVFGVLAVTQAMLPLLREAPAARIVNVSSGVGSLTRNSDPRLPLDLRPRLRCVQDGSQRYDARHGDRAGVDRDQGQRRLPGLHQDEPQQLYRHADSRGGCPRAGAPRAPRRERSDGHVLKRGRPTPVVSSRSSDIGKYSGIAPE